MNAFPVHYTATLPDGTIVRLNAAEGVTKTHVVVVRIENGETSRWKLQAWRASEESAVDFINWAKQRRAAYEVRPNLGDNSKYVEWRAIPVTVEPAQEEGCTPAASTRSGDTKHNIVNPDKWVGKYVRHMANSRAFQWLKGDDDNATDDYFVDEWTGKLWRACDQAGWYGTFETYEEAVAAGYDECYYYSADGLYQMWAATKAVLVA